MMRAPIVAAGARASLRACNNCGRPANADLCGLSAQGDNERFYCSTNCYWSETLDVSKSRLRRKKHRAPRGGRACRVRPVVAETGAICADSDSTGSAEDDGRGALAAFAFCLSGVSNVRR